MHLVSAARITILHARCHGSSAIRQSRLGTGLLEFVFAGIAELELAHGQADAEAV